jgi:hypothetical protein
VTLVWRFIAFVIGIRMASMVADWLRQRRARRPPFARVGRCLPSQCVGGAAVCPVRAQERPTAGSAQPDDVAAQLAGMAAMQAALDATVAKATAQADQGAARAAARARGESEIFGDGDAHVYGLVPDPVPLHPRPIEGAEIRCRPPVPVDQATFAILMGWERPLYEKRRFGWKGKRRFS